MAPAVAGGLVRMAAGSALSTARRGKLDPDLAAAVGNVPVVFATKPRPIFLFDIKSVFHLCNVANLPPIDVFVQHAI